MGDSVMVSPGGLAIISYSDGCKVDVQSGAVTTITSSSPCASESHAQDGVPLQAATRLPGREIAIDPEIIIKADSTSSAAKGTYKTKDGKENESTDDEVKHDTNYNKQYDGPTQFKADYTIVKKADGSVDYDKSFIQFTTVNYTHQKYRTTKDKDGKEIQEKLGKPQTVSSDFKTQKIKITDVTFNKDGSVKTIKFSSTDWYDPKGPLAKVLINKGLSGEIDLSTGKGTFQAKYQNPYNGVISTYDVTGKVGAPAPPPPRAPAPPPKPIATQPSGPVGVSGDNLGPSLAIGGLAGLGILLYESRPRPSSP